MQRFRSVIGTKLGSLSSLYFTHRLVAYQATQGESVASKMCRVYWYDGVLVIVLPQKT